MVIMPSLSLSLLLHENAIVQGVPFCACLTISSVTLDSGCLQLLPPDALTVIAESLLGNASSELVVDDGLALFQFSFTRRELLSWFLASLIFSSLPLNSDIFCDVVFCWGFRGTGFLIPSYCCFCGGQNVLCLVTVPLVVDMGKVSREHGESGKHR